MPTEFEYTGAGDCWVEIAKRIKREPAEIVKKLFMMGVMIPKPIFGWGKQLNPFMVDYELKPNKKAGGQCRYRTLLRGR